MDKQNASDTFALFVKAVEGAMVRRYGTKTSIGVTADGKGTVKWDTETIHALTRDEVNQHGHLYLREIKEKALVACTREQWEAQRAKRKAEAKEAAEKAAANAPSATAEKGG